MSRRDEVVSRSDEPIHVAVETGGHFSLRAAEPVLRRVDLVFFDLKLADEAAHRRHLGRSNRRVLANLRVLASWRQAAVESPAGPEPRVGQGPRVVIRTPVVPGVTDSEENLQAVLAIARDVGLADIRLLPYNPAGLDQYAPIGRPRPSLSESFVPAGEWRALLERVRRW